MENALIALISMAIILGGTMTLMLGSIPSIDMLSSSWKQMTQQAGEMRRTELTTDNYTISDGGAQVNVIISNNGEVSLSDFSSWDVIIKYSSDTSSYAKWLPYTPDNLTDNKWTVDGIYFNGSAETIEPNILNPGEDMEILIQLNPEVATSTTNWVTISTPNGIAAHLIFQRGGT